MNQFATLASLVESAGAQKRNLWIRGVCPPARALLAASLFQEMNTRPALCIVSDWQKAEQFAEELAFFSSLFHFKEGTDPAKRRILLFPPGLPAPPGLMHASITAAQDRIRTLLALMETGSPAVVVTSQDALREKVPPREAFETNIRTVRAGETLERDTLAGHLQEGGYKRVPVVEAPGEYAVRGSLIDLFPLPEEQPFRVDFFGDTIDGIRPFLPETQRSLEPVDSVTIPPAALFIPRAVDMDRVRARVKGRSDAENLPATKHLELLERIETGLSRHEIPALLPFFYTELHSLLDYIGRDVLALALDPERIRRTGLDLQEECSRSLDQMTARGKVVPRVNDLFLDIHSLWEEMRRGLMLAFSDLPGYDDLTLEARESEPAGAGLDEEQGSGRVDSAVSGSGTAGPEGIGTGKEKEQEALVVRFDFQSLHTARLSGLKEKPAKGLSGFARMIRTWIEEGQRVFLVCGSEPEKMRLGHLLHEYDLPFVQPTEKVPFDQGSAGLYLLRGALSQGFLFPQAGMIFLHEEDIFGRKVRKHRIPEKPLPAAIDLKELNPGDHVVHIDFGIGFYKGLETLNIRGYINDYLQLEYANNDRLYLPVDRASRIQKYVSTEDLPPTLDKLGGTTWVRTKNKVKESILAMAEELVSLYASRMVKKGHGFSAPDPSFEEFEATFPYEETPDQMRAIQEVVWDMEKDRPMDRLVCGDVGYGKTEVAIRAAYKSVMDGKQVAVLVPTTVLAQQHYGNFLSRFQDYPVEVRMLSRFRSPKQQRETLKEMKDGRADIVIGTHRLLQKDVSFRDLGLLILDEEQRFGVRHKETLKKMRTEVDVLTLSATPIPRTLQMSLLGLRDLSSIKTPPQDRYAIETYVVPFDPEIIHRALTRELARGGQAFFVHNRVSDIEAMAERLKTIVPEARIAIGHGQMPEKALERVMMEFVRGDHDILVCTTIIESGLDIPNANTLLVHRADRFGLAQLYQLRGRVGRAERQAYAYLIVPEEDRLSSNARKRLEVLYEFTELGAGFRIARYDLEIRGSGNLLGTSQSGQIRAVGYDLYMEYLEKAIRELKGEEVVEEVDPELHFEIPAFLPGEYIEDSTQRLSFYKRLATAKDHDEVNKLLAEIKDRYGPLPAHAQTLIDLIHIKVRLRRLRIREARLAEEGLLVSFAPHTPVSVDRILAWAAQEPERLRLFPDDRLLVRFTASDSGEQLKNIEQILAWLEKGSEEP